MQGIETRIFQAVVQSLYQLGYHAPTLTHLNIQRFYVLPTEAIYVFFCRSENKQRLFPYTTLTDWLL
jgi:hypothetical protein